MVDRISTALDDHRGGCRSSSAKGSTAFASGGSRDAPARRRGRFVRLLHAELHPDLRAHCDARLIMSFTVSGSHRVSPTQT